MKYEELISDQPDIEPPPVATKLGAEWLMEGVVVLEKFMPDDLIDAYCEAHEREGLGQDAMDATPYMRVPELLDFLTYQPLSKVLQEIIGKSMSVHLNLTGWLSTERDFHQDAYLSPPEVQYYYAAVWFALDDIHPDSGPFEWVPRSHQWPLLSAEKIRAQIPEDRRNLPSWPKDSEAILTPAIEEKIALNGVAPKRFLGRRGDVLIWHARTVHRGSPPKVPGMQRKALIAHYSAIDRADMAPAIKHGGGWYFPFHDGRAG